MFFVCMREWSEMRKLSQIYRRSHYLVKEDKEYYLNLIPLLFRSEKSNLKVLPTHFKII